MKKLDLVGERFGKLLVVGMAENIGKNTSWLCRCDCGVEKPVLTYNLQAGKSLSCGCVRGVKIGDFARTHSGSGTKIYAIYKGMKQRCNNDKNPAYKWYGGKGVCICTQWLESFEAFREWAISNGFKDGLSIDRINPDGGYNPGNCRWITMKKQANNKLNSMFIVIDDEKFTIAEWAERSKSNKPSLYDKFYRLLEQLGVENKDVLSFEIKTKKLGGIK